MGQLATVRGGCRGGMGQWAYVEIPVVLCETPNCLLNSKWRWNDWCKRKCTVMYYLKICKDAVFWINANIVHVPVLNIWYLETLWGELFFILILNSNFFIFCIKVSNRERKMSSLQSQLHDLHKEISRRDSEITNHQQTIKMMQEKQRYLSGEVNHQFCLLQTCIHISLGIFS